MQSTDVAHCPAISDAIKVAIYSRQPEKVSSLLVAEDLIISVQDFKGYLESLSNKYATYTWDNQSAMEIHHLLDVVLFPSHALKHKPSARPLASQQQIPAHGTNTDAELTSLNSCFNGTPIKLNHPTA